jgi:hypothetical protein
VVAIKNGAEMKTNKRMTVDELVERFADIALSQYEALRRHKVGRFNRLFDQMEAVRQELGTREGNQRRALMKLYDHPKSSGSSQGGSLNTCGGPESSEGRASSHR